MPKFLTQTITSPASHDAGIEDRVLDAFDAMFGGAAKVLLSWVSAVSMLLPECSPSLFYGPSIFARGLLKI